MASYGQLVIRKTIELYARGAEKVNEEVVVMSNHEQWEEAERVLKEHIERRSQEAKADEGKLQITLVPRQIIRDIARVRMFGTAKYGDPDNWRRVEIERYRDAMCRHLLAYLDDPKGVDEESGLPHLAHLATNVAFLCEMEKWRRDEKRM